MGKNPLIKVFDKAEIKDCLPDSAQIVEFEIDIAGEMVEFQIHVMDGDMKLADIVLLAQMVGDKIIDVTVVNAESNGNVISCVQGCSACCNYLVPLSVPEALWLRKEISSQAQTQQRQVMRACLMASRRILKCQPPVLFINQKTQTPQSSSDVNLISNWYKSLKLQCPFLKNKICTIYQARPLACREHIAINPAGSCRGDQRAELVEIAVSMVDVLVQLTAELEEADPEAVVMPLLLAWCDGNLERSEQTWPAAVIVGRFVKIIKTIANQSRELATKQTVC